MASSTNHSSVWQEQLAFADTADVCFEAARQTLAALGSHPLASGLNISGKLGSRFKMQLLGIPFCPVKWLPVTAEIAVTEATDHRLVTITVRDRLGFGIADMPRIKRKFEGQCTRTGIAIRDAINERLAAAT